MAADHNYWVYIVANWRRSVLYVGVTNDIVRRVDEHHRGTGSEFTSKYRAFRLVHCEHTSEVEAAIRREKEIKGWTRKKKDALVSANNPEWRDLAEDFR